MADGEAAKPEAREARWQAGGSSPPLLIASNGQQDQAGQDENEDGCCVSATGQQGQADEGKGSRSQIWITLDDEQSRGSPSRNNWLLMVILSGVGSLSGDKQMIEGDKQLTICNHGAQYNTNPGHIVVLTSCVVANIEHSAESSLIHSRASPAKVSTVNQLLSSS